MNNCINLHFDVDGDNFASAGEVSENVKMRLKQIGIDPKIIRKVSISLYEAEINMVLHAGGGKVEVEIYEDKIKLKLIDHGPGIENLELAMTEGYSTAPDYVRSLGFGAGMGMPNMKKYADVLDVDTKVNEGTTVNIIIYFDNKDK